MPRRSPTIVLLPRQRSVLEHLIRSSTSEHRIVERAKIIVTAADGDIPAEQSVKLRIDRQRIRRWRERFAEAADLLNAAELELDLIRFGGQFSTLLLPTWPVRSHTPLGSGSPASNAGGSD